jgi:hypothetical protein
MNQFRTFLFSTLALISAGSLWAGSTQILQNDPSITYTGVWYPNFESGNINGSATLTNDKGAQAAVTFTGTGITWIGVLDQYSGIAQVYLDGTPNTVDTYAPNTLYQQPLFAAHGLAAGTHTLSIQVLHQRDGNTNGSWIWINAFNIENGSSVTGGVSATGLVQQNDPSLIYSGNWYLNSNPVMSGGSAVLATDPGSNATLTFTGSGVQWIAYRDQWSGIANVYVDGTLNSTIDTYANPQQAQTVAFAITGLVPGLHTLAIGVTGTHDAASGGSWIWVDAFNVTP